LKVAPTVPIGKLPPKNHVGAENVSQKGTAFVSGEIIATILRPWNSALMAFEYFGVEVAP
jgi:hypothetical protein